MMLAVLLGCVLAGAGQEIQDPPLTPEAVAATIERLVRIHIPDSAETYFPQSLTTKFQREVGRELVRLSQAPEEMFRKLRVHLFPLTGDAMDGWAAKKLVYCRLIFLLRYHLPPKPGGYTDDDFYKYHEHLVIPMNLGRIAGYEDYPTLESTTNLTIGPHELYDWPWRRTKDGWKLRWFTYRMGGGMQDYDSMYEQFSKLPLRKDVSPPLTPQDVAASIKSLAKERLHLIPLVHGPDSLKTLSRELIRLNRASEETIRKAGALLGGNESAPLDGMLIISRLLFLLRYCPPPEPAGFTRDLFFKYHEHLKVPPLNHEEFEDRKAYLDYPTPEQYGEGRWLTLDPRDYYDWPWRLTKDGWQVRLFTYSMGGGMQDYDSMYEQFSKLPLRKDVSPPLTPEAVAVEIERLAMSYNEQGLSNTQNPEFRERLSKELIRLNRASEDTIRKVGDVLLEPLDELVFEKLVMCRLLFLLRYRPPTPPGGFSEEDFNTYHANLLPPINVHGLEEYNDYPTATSTGLTLRPNLYDWPWQLTSDGWRIRWFTVRGHGLQSFDYMYEQFSKLPLRKDVYEVPPQPLTPEAVAAEIERLAEDYESRHKDSRDPAYREELSNALVRLNRAPEETVRRLEGMWSTGYDELNLPRTIITTLWFVLRYRPPTPEGGFTDMDFTSFHGKIYVPPRLVAGESEDFPTLSSPGYDALKPRDRYDWPWELTKNGWQLRWFAVHGGGSEGFEGIYERFRKFPLRKGVNAKGTECAQIEGGERSRFRFCMLENWAARSGRCRAFA